MASKIINLTILLNLMRLATTSLVPQPILAPAPIVTDTIDPNPAYSFAYDVQDSLTGDSKGQVESRANGVVRGQYSVADPDGTRRIVDYYADPVHGFNAVVRKVPLGAVPKIVAPAPVVPAPLVPAAPLPHLHAAPVAPLPHLHAVPAAPVPLPAHLHAFPAAPAPLPAHLHAFPAAAAPLPAHLHAFPAAAAPLPAHLHAFPAAPAPLPLVRSHPAYVGRAVVPAPARLASPYVPSIWG